MDLITKFAEKSIAITPAQMNDMIKRLWDGNFIDSDKGKVKGAKYFAIYKHERSKRSKCS